MGISIAPGVLVRTLTSDSSAWGCDIPGEASGRGGGCVVLDLEGSMSCPEEAVIGAAALSREGIAGV